MLLLYAGSAWFQSISFNFHRKWEAPPFHLFQIYPRGSVSPPSSLSHCHGVHDRSCTPKQWTPKKLLERGSSLDSGQKGQGLWSPHKVRCVCVCVYVDSGQSCLTLCNPLDCSSSGSSVHGILQARTLELVAISFSRDLPNPGIEPGSLASPALAGDSVLAHQLCKK